MREQQDVTIGEVYRLIENMRDNEIARIQDTLIAQNSRIRKAETRLTRVETVGAVVWAVLSALTGWIGFSK